MPARRACRRGRRAVSRGLVIIAGAGDVGGRLARLRAARGDEVIALRRRDAGPAPGVRGHRADLASGAGLATLPREASALVFCAAPDARDEASYRRLYVDGLRRLRDAVDAPRFVFVSSSAVYGEDAGEWVDETTPPRPTAFNGRVLLEAEAVLRGHAGGSVLRASGLYGPGRDLLWRKARAGEPGRAHWTNRLHVDDAAAALSHLLGLPAPGPVYIGTDDRPAPEHEVLAYLRERLGLPPLPPATGPATGRRLCNAALRATGWTPAFPDFRAGYTDPPPAPGV